MQAGSERVGGTAHDKSRSINLQLDGGCCSSERLRKAATGTGPAVSQWDGISGQRCFGFALEHFIWEVMS